MMSVKCQHLFFSLRTLFKNFSFFSKAETFESHFVCNNTLLRFYLDTYIEVLGKSQVF